MARARNIKPGFFTNDLLAEIHPLGRLLFSGLWTIADRAGRLEDRPKKIKVEILPFDNCNVDKLLDALAERGFIQRYTINKSQYLQIVKWNRHQNPHVKEGASTIPAPCSTPTEHRTSTVQTPCSTQPKPERARLIPDSGFRIPDSLNLIPDSSSPSEKANKSPPPRKTHYRLEAFIAEYKSFVGRDYLVANFSKDGGAAKRTVSLIPDDSVYRQAVRAYLAATDKRIVESSWPFAWFVNDLNRWANATRKEISAPYHHEMVDLGKYPNDTTEP